MGKNYDRFSIKIKLLLAFTCPSFVYNSTKNQIFKKDLTNKIAKNADIFPYVHPLKKK